MSLYQRKDSPHWWIAINHKGRRIQRSTGIADKQKAQEYHDTLKASLWEQDRLGVKPDYTWNDAVVQWSKETKHKASFDDALRCIRWLDNYLGGLKLKDIDRALLERIIEARQCDDVTNATINRTMEVVRAILRKAAFEWDWLDRVPKFRMLPEPKKRVRFLTHKEAAALLDELPAHLTAMVSFSLETGLRRRNVTHLEWSQVDLDRRMAWIHPDQAKAGKAIPVPLTNAAVQVLREQLGKDATFVFVYNGHPVKQPNNWAWRKALKRAGIDDFRWHDMRHTWASWHVQAGTPLNVLQELGGWSCPEMVQKYAHLNSDHLAKYADRMSEKNQRSDKITTLRLAS
ncbi:MAG: site-specific integrase [Gammaproteobacteria bacterium]